MESEQKLTNFGKFTHCTWYKKTLNWLKSVCHSVVDPNSLIIIIDSLNSGIQGTLTILNQAITTNIHVVWGLICMILCWRPAGVVWFHYHTVLIPNIFLQIRHVIGKILLGLFLLIATLYKTILSHHVHAQFLEKSPFYICIGLTRFVPSLLQLLKQILTTVVHHHLAEMVEHVKTR